MHPITCLRPTHRITCMSHPKHCARPGGVGPSPSPPSPPPIPGLKIPRLKQLRIIALDPTGNLRDPSAVVQDPVTGKWHFWVVYMPGATQPGWQGFLHHYEVMITSVFHAHDRRLPAHDLFIFSHHYYDHCVRCHTDRDTHTLSHTSVHTHTRKHTHENTHHVEIRAHGLQSVNSSIDTTEWASFGLALNHSSDPHAFDSGGMFSPSAIYDPNGSAPGW